MQPEIGKIYEGKVTGITKFGAFVDIGEGVSGMVHISEVSNTFVNDIKDHLTMGEEVKVKIIGIAEDGKVSMSIKKALPPSPVKDRREQKGRNDSFQQRARTYTPNNERSSAPQSFEDMLSKFKASSDEKMGDIRRNMDGKRRNTSRKR